MSELRLRSVPSSLQATKRQFCWITCSHTLQSVSLMQTPTLLSRCPSCKLSTRIMRRGPLHSAYIMIDTDNIISHLTYCQVSYNEAKTAMSTDPHKFKQLVTERYVCVCGGGTNNLYIEYETDANNSRKAQALSYITFLQLIHKLSKYHLPFLLFKVFQTFAVWLSGNW